MTRKAAPAAAAPVLKAEPVETRTLQERVEYLERAVRALLLGQQNPAFKGKLLPRCRCRKFVTRTIRFENPFAMTHSELLCDTCVFHHPLEDVKGSKVSEAPIWDDPEAEAFAAALNKSFDVLKVAE